MGNGDSKVVRNKTTTEVLNDIAQISDSSCVNVITTSSEIRTEIINTVIRGDINITRVAAINGISCVLKAALSNTLTNDLDNTQDGTVEDVNELDPLSRLADNAAKITPWGAASDMISSLSGDKMEVNNEIVQKVVNQITQQMSATCQNKISNEGAPIITLLEGSKLGGDLNITDEQKISETSCVIENTTKNFVQNDISNSQDGTVKKEESNGLIGAFTTIVFIIILGGVLTTFLGKKKTSKKTSTAAVPLGKPGTGVNPSVPSTVPSLPNK